MAAKWVIERDPRSIGLHAHRALLLEDYKDSGKQVYAGFDGSGIDIGIIDLGTAGVDNVSAELSRGEKLSDDELQDFMSRHDIPMIPARLFGYLLSGLPTKAFIKL